MRPIRSQTWVIVAVIVAIGLLGAIELISTHAAGTSVALEPERATLSGAAVSTTDPNASAGKAVRFGSQPAPSPVTPSSPTPTTTPVAGAPMPLGVPGNWILKFDDEFSGTALDTTKWSAMEGGTMNNVTTHASNVTVAGGSALLNLASSSSGAEICTCNASNPYNLPVGGYTEARVYFPGTSGGAQYNWPAWWVSGPNWPAAGEHDIVEGYDSSLSAGNYHSPAGANNGPHPAGSWVNGYHVYGVWRKATSAEIYWDGKLVRSYATSDNGQPESLIANVGAGNIAMYGTGSQVRIDYVRAWQP